MEAIIIKLKLENAWSATGGCDGAQIINAFDSRNPGNAEFDMLHRQAHNNLKPILYLVLY